MSIAIPAPLVQRQPFRPSVKTPRDAVLFDRYIQSRNRYKEDLIELLAQKVSSGPVLELNNGFGSIGLELLRRRPVHLDVVCPSKETKHLAQRKARKAGMVKNYRPWQCNSLPFPFSHEEFELIYSINCLHEWEDPGAVIRAAWELLREDGCLIINDLRRDSDPFITEYVIREMAAVDTEEGRFRLKVFLRGLGSAYTAEELQSLLQESGTLFVVDGDEPMTLTARIGKRAAA